MAFRKRGLTRPPPGLPLHHPACFIATWFGSGLLPGMPGTWGSLAAMPFGIAISAWLGPTALVAAAVVLFAPGWWAAARYSHAAALDDPGPVVVDEVVAQWLVLSVAAADEPIAIVLAFLSFRFFDILKPWPVRQIERRFEGGFGIMIDDVIAAIYAIFVVILYNYTN